MTCNTIVADTMMNKVLKLFAPLLLFFLLPATGASHNREKCKITSEAYVVNLVSTSSGGTDLPQRDSRQEKFFNDFMYGLTFLRNASLLTKKKGSSTMFSGRLLEETITEEEGEWNKSKGICEVFFHADNIVIFKDKQKIGTYRILSIKATTRRERNNEIIMAIDCVDSNNTNCEISIHRWERIIPETGKKRFYRAVFVSYEDERADDLCVVDSNSETGESMLAMGSKSMKENEINVVPAIQSFYAAPGPYRAKQEDGEAEVEFHVYPKRISIRQWVSDSIITEEYMVKRCREEKGEIVNDKGEMIYDVLLLVRVECDGANILFRKNGIIVDCGGEWTEYTIKQ